jgi:hypothetical protein
MISTLSLRDASERISSCTTFGLPIDITRGARRSICTRRFLARKASSAARSSTAPSSPIIGQTSVLSTSVANDKSTGPRRPDEGA